MFNFTVIVYFYGIVEDDPVCPVIQEHSLCSSSCTEGTITARKEADREAKKLKDNCWGRRATPNTEGHLGRVGAVSPNGVRPAGSQRGAHRCMALGGSRLCPCQFHFC